MANKDRIVRTTRTEVERLPAKEGDPIAGRLHEGMKGYAQFTVAGFVEAFWNVMSDDMTARLDVFKRLAGQFMKKGELLYQQTDPDDVESYIVATWGSGVYQLRPMVSKKYHSPVSVPYKIGDSGEDDKGGGQSGSDGLEELVGRLAVAKQLKELREGLVSGEKGDDGMKAAEVQAMMSATLAPLQTMLDATARRAEQAEQRNHELQLKLLDMAQGRQQTTQGSVAELIKLMPKEALAALLSPADAPGWAEKAVDALREFAPAMVQMLMEYFRPGGAARAALPAAAESQEPQPTETAAAPGGGGGSRPMPLQLNPEQMEAKKLLLECIRERDFDNAFAMVQNFPGFTPTANGPMPIGDAFLSMVDPKVTRPRIYVIQMMQLVPELAQMLDAADAFIAFIQKKLMDDQEAFVREQNGARRAGAGAGASDPRPTTQGEDER